MARPIRASPETHVDPSVQESSITKKRKEL